MALRKNPIVLLILFLFCLWLSSCGINSSNEHLDVTAEETTTENTAISEDAHPVSVFSRDVITVNDETVVYNDGKIEFRWNKNEWILSADSYGLPYLQKRVDGLVVQFKIFDCVEGAAEDLVVFSGSALQKAFPDYDSNKQFAYGNDEACEGKNCYGIKTGYYTANKEREGNEMAIVHSLSNGSVSCVYGVMFKGGVDMVADLYDELLSTHDPAFLEDYVRDVIDTFRFVS